MRKPRIFVSSTCYDLGQVRADLKAFIDDDLGYEAVLSEYPSFPVDPDKTTIESCRSAVRANCDVLVLIVGDRYGTIDSSTKRSITNGEYLEARALEVPVYAFVLKSVLALLPTWRNDRSAAIPNIEPGVLKFVDELYQSSNWVFPFELAKDITTTLRVQWAYMFEDGLVKRKLLGKGGAVQKLGLTGNALDIALRKDRFWEYRLFLCLMDEELEARGRLRRDFEIKFSALTSIPGLDRSEFVSWIKPKVSAVETLLQKWRSIVSDLVPEAFGPPGEPGDVEKIAYVTSRLGLIYEASLHWALEFEEVKVQPEFANLHALLSRLDEDLVYSFGRIHSDIGAVLEKADADPPQMQGRITLDWTVAITPGLMDDVGREITRLAL